MTDEVLNSVKMSWINGRPVVRALRHSIFEHCITNNIVQTLGTPNTVKDISMTLTYEEVSKFFSIYY